MIKPYYQDEWVTIYNADCREILPELPDGSISMVHTDPPYPREFLYCYDALSKFTPRVLEDGGFLYAYLGAETLPDIIKYFDGKLDWFWLFNIKHNGGAPRMWNKHLMVTSKPIVVYTKGKPRELKWCANDFVIENTDKRFHEWGQSIGFPLQHIEMRTNPTDTVLDPFMGAGTSLLAAKILGRKSIGCDISEESCEIAAKRCMQTVMNFEPVKEKPKQGVLMS